MIHSQFPVHKIQYYYVFSITALFAIKISEWYTTKCHQW